MVRLLSRVLGVWLLAAALIIAVVDGAKSIAASSFILTPLAETWGTVAGWAGVRSAGADAAAQPWPLDVALAWLWAAPTVAVLAALSFVFLAAGRRRRERTYGRPFAA